jgi:hypothetical protein
MNHWKAESDIAVEDHHYPASNIKPLYLAVEPLGHWLGAYNLVSNVS